MAAEDYIPSRERSSVHINNCDGAEIRRKNSKTYKPFIGCTNYPRCKFSRELTSSERIEYYEEENKAKR